MTGFTVEKRHLGDGAPVFIIAEIGINHGGSEDVARAMIESAAASGADAVKFQTVDAEQSYLPDTESYREFRDKGLSREAILRLDARARALGIVPFSTPGDLSSLRLMLDTGCQLIKISSGQLTNVPLLRAAGKSGRPVILSTGMADLAEVEAAVGMLRSAGSRQIALLHCTSLYPAQANELNLRAIQTMRQAFDLPIGYSDHHPGPLACLAAVAAGACILEKHFTLDRMTPGADHAISAEPEEFAELVRNVRLVEAMLGYAEKRPMPEEVRLRPARWRSIVAAAEFPIGTVLTSDMLLAKRAPLDAGGLPISEFDRVVGRRLLRAVKRDDLIREDMLGAAS